MCHLKIQNLEFAQFTDTLIDSKIKDLLAYAIYNPTPERINNKINELYAKQDAEIWVLKSQRKMLAVLGVKQLKDRLYEILHIAVLPEFRGLGLGRIMIEQIIKEKNMTELVAETDQDAVEFYKKCGFKITKNDNNIYSDTVRFICRKMCV